MTAAKRVRTPAVYEYQVRADNQVWGLVPSDDPEGTARVLLDEDEAIRVALAAKKSQGLPEVWINKRRVIDGQPMKWETYDA